MNIKNKLIFSFIVLLYGCASASWAPQSSHQYDGVLITKVTDYSELKTENNSLKGEAMNIETGERLLEGNMNPEGITYHRGQVGSFKWGLLYNCERFTGGKCVISRFMDEVYYSSHDELITEMNKKKQETLLLRQNQELQKQEDEAKKRIAVIQALKVRCVSYGFEGSNNIAACVQREAQHDYELEQKDYELQIARQRLNEQTQMQQEPSIWLAILGALAEGVAEGYKQSQIISALDQRYEPRNRDIYRYCRPNC